MQPPSLHSSFFSSLKRVEKRLKLEHQTQHPSSSQPVQESNSKLASSTESLGSPIYLHLDQTHNNSTQLSKKAATVKPHKHFYLLLGISDHFEERSEKEVDRVGVRNCCECEGGFYDKLVGVKGPKCEKEMERLEGWIKYFLRSCKDDEPLRLAYLLMGKAAFALDGDDCGFGGLEFP